MKLSALSILLTAALSCAPALADESAAHAAQGGAQRIRAAAEHILDANTTFAAAHGPEYFEPFAQGQTPLATVIACSDSRVHMHAIDQSPDNDVFVIRNIGNQIATSEGSVEYGIDHLHTPLLLIVGHSGCGAVTAAIGDYSKESEAIRRELDSLQVKAGGDLSTEIVHNVNDQVAAALEKFKPQVDAGALAVFGAIYDFRNDYGDAPGSLIVININGETDPAKIAASPYLAGIKKVNLLSSARR